MAATSLRRFTMGIGAAAVGVMLAGPANATVIAYSTDGISYTTLASAGSGTTVQYGLSPTTVGGITINTMSAGSNSPGAGIAKLLSSTLDLTNNTQSTQTLWFAFADGGFTTPTAPPVLQLDSHVGGSLGADSPANLMSFLSCVVPGAPSGGTTSCSGGTSTPAGTPSITAGSFNNDQYANFTSLSSPYGITEIMEITLGAGSDLNFAANSTLKVVPEPMSMALMAVGLLGLSLVYRRRRQA